MLMAAVSFERQPLFMRKSSPRINFTRTTKLNFMSPSSRFTQQIGVAGSYDDGFLRIEYDNYFVVCAGQRVKMPRTEFLILTRLTQSPDRFVTYEELWKFAWGAGKPFSLESLKVYIYNLRRHFEPFGIKFETMVNVGYSFLSGHSES